MEMETAAHFFYEVGGSVFSKFLLSASTAGASTHTLLVRADEQTKETQDQQASQWEEAFGLVVAEAMACGKPVVATRVGGISEIVTEGETGYLVGREDTTRLAGCILDLLRQDEVQARFGEARRQRMRQHFEVSCMANAYVRHLLGEH